MTAVSETGDAIETHSVAAPAPSFLTGETIYLRGMELSDAKWGTAWRGSPFPITAEKLEEKLKKDLPKQAQQHRTRLIACRRSDGRPLGAVTVDDSGYLSTEISLVNDPALGGEGAALQAEMLRVVVPWLSAERKRPVVRLITDVDMQPVLSAAESLGMRPSVQLRHGVWRQGKLRDMTLSRVAQSDLDDAVRRPRSGFDGSRHTCGATLLAGASPRFCRATRLFRTMP